MKRLRWLLAAFALALTAAVLAFAWLIGTGGGRDFALARLLATLPPDMATIGAADGTLGGTLRLRDVRMQLPDGTRATIADIELRQSPYPWLRTTAWLESASVGDVEIVLPPVDENAPPTPLPDAMPWPQLTLPVALRIDRLQVRDLRIVRADAALLRMSAFDAGVRLSVDGRLQLDALHVATDRGSARGAGWIAFDGTPSAALQFELASAVDAATNARLRIDGDGRTLALQLDADDARVTAQVARDLQWTLDSDLADFDPAAWGIADAPVLDLAVVATGTRERIELRGEWRGEQPLEIEQARVALQPDAIVLEALTVKPASGGVVELRGTVQRDAPQLLSLAGTVDALPLPLEGDDEPLLLNARLQIGGEAAAPAFDIDGELRRADLHVPLRLLAQRDGDGLQLDALTIAGAHGRLGASGRVQWAPQVEWELAATLEDFDPAPLLPQLPGRIDGRLRSRGAIVDDTVQLTVELDDIGGELRGRPLRGRGTATYTDAQVDADLALTIGDSRLQLRGTGRDVIDLRLQLQPLLLADVVPDSAGRVQGEIRLFGAREQLQVDTQLAGTAIAIAGVTVDTVALDGAAQLKLDAGNAELRADGVRIGERTLDTVVVEFDGGRARQQLRLRADAAEGTLTATIGGTRDAERWSGRVDALTLQSRRGMQWTLRAPAALAWTPEQWSVAPVCIDAAPRAVCVELAGDGAQQRIELQAEALPLAEQAHWFGVRDELALTGIVAVQAELQVADGALRDAAVGLRLSEGAAIVQREQPVTLIEWQPLQLDAVLAGERLRIEGGGTLDTDGSVRIALDGGSPLRDGDGALTGTLALQLPRLRALELLAPELAGADGRVQGTLQIGGTWRQPRFAGAVDVVDLRGEVAALGITVSDSKLSVKGDGEQLAIDATFATGGGPLRVQGALQPLASPPTGRLSITGERVRAADTERVSAVVSPDLTAELTAQGLRLRGSIAVPEARIDLERLEGAVRPSGDVVVLDAAGEAPERSGFALDAEITATLGDKVVLKGFGFDGGISGTLRVRERPGRVTTGRGALDVRGKYRAYGQKLDIERGRLLFASSPLDDPGVDVRARREIGDVTVGLQVRGSALQPQLSVWSDPALDQAEALSYLVLGRPLRAASSADGAQLGQAAAAVGGNLLAARIGGRLGFDTFGVADSDSLGGAAFTVGKYLSPALYLSYGVALFGDGQVLNLKYLLSDRVEIEVESGVENRAGINYKMER